MKISDIKIRLINIAERRLVGVASIIIDDCFAIHDIKIIQGQDGEFIAMPSRKTPDGSFKDIVHPINSETRAQFSDAILEAYHKEIEVLKK